MTDGFKPANLRNLELTKLIYIFPVQRTLMKTRVNCCDQQLEWRIICEWKKSEMKKL